MKTYFKAVAAQTTGILLAAAGAAVFTFAQSVASQTGVCPTPNVSPVEVGTIGALFKGVHSALTTHHWINV